MRCQASGRSRFAVIDALNAEWEDLQHDRPSNGHARQEIMVWAEEWSTLRDCRSPADVLVAIRTDPDPVLAALITIHQSFLRSTPPSSRTVHLAGRIVLQTMLGKIVTMARRDPDHAVEDYIGQLWARIGSYPLARRPRRIAANLALDTLKSVTRDSHGSLATRFVPVTAVDLEWARMRGAGGHLGVLHAGDPDYQGTELTAHRVLRTAHDLGLIDESTCSLLLTVYADGMSSADAAARHGLTPTTVRFRCSKAIRRLARHATSIANAA